MQQAYDVRIIRNCKVAADTDYHQCKNTESRENDPAPPFIFRAPALKKNGISRVLVISGRETIHPYT
jgi:hypothetical protein